MISRIGRVGADIFDFAVEIIALCETIGGAIRPWIGMRKPERASERISEKRVLSQSVRLRRKALHRMIPGAECIFEDASGRR